MPNRSELTWVLGLSHVFVGEILVFGVTKDDNWRHRCVSDRGVNDPSLGSHGEWSPDLKGNIFYRYFWRGYTVPRILIVDSNGTCLTSLVLGWDRVVHSCPTWVYTNTWRSVPHHVSPELGSRDEAEESCVSGRPYTSTVASVEWSLRGSVRGLVGRGRSPYPVEIQGSSICASV